ncbi:MAG: Transcriptional regulatory protein, repressor-type [Candidatus Kaiserbacteria bacterium GW2011_GWA2_58_9]|uniref:Transcriptional regulatory protein, repressor-type n=1 Tax=Candidatus Kaiserbacteria bacterium GW2011_GWA2_58_9 TaxID=1618672 RepID=A0A0G2B1N6_9BACT|nr:MAG: Transcriptional regulatory protein, repressor-type [Candidatus Kaiserbacteria bacterium GW2011_GWA2_58_9]
MRISGIKFQRPSEKTIRILKMIGVGVLVVGIGAVPPPWALARVLKELAMGDTQKNRRWATRRIYEARRRGYVRGVGERYALSDIGRRLVEEGKLWELKISVPKRWDGRWHIVAFDIPQELSKARIPFIRHLQNLGLVFYQRSLWIHPHPCADEVREIANFHGVLPHVSFITATHVDGSADLQRRFKITT